METVGIFYLVTRAADNGREDGTRRVISGKAGLHQTGAVVAHEGGGLVVVAHGVTSETYDKSR